MMRRLTFAVVTSLTLAAGAPAASAAPQRPVAAAVVPSAQPAAPQPAATDAARYTDRDATQRTADFTGGSLIVIGISGTALIVGLVVLLILL